jgi:hypothetical protein
METDNGFVDVGGDEAASSRPEAGMRAMHRALSVEDFAERASKIIDVKGVCKPSVFNGEDQLWPEWRYRMENLFKLIGTLEFVKASLTMEERALQHSAIPERAEGASKFTHGILVATTSGKALTTVKLAGENGFVAWKRLVELFEPRRALRYTSMLRGLLNPQWSDKKDFMTQWAEWERDIEEYEQASGEIFPDSTRCATVFQWAPKSIQECLRNCTVDCMASYRTLTEQLRMHLFRQQSFTATGQIQSGSGSADGPIPMDVGSAVAWFLGKGKGKDKGKGKGFGKGKDLAKGKGKGGQLCRNCGKPGHYARDCWQKASGKGKDSSVCNRCGKSGHWARDCRVNEGGKGVGGGYVGSKGGGKKGKEKGKGQSRWFEGNCLKCGTYGHRKQDCWKLFGADALDGDEQQQHPLQSEQDFGGQQEETKGVRVIRIPEEEEWPCFGAGEADEDDDEKVFAAAVGGGCRLMLVDSGAFEHVCPLNFGDGLKVGIPRRIVAADGKEISYHGVREVKFNVWNKDPTKARFVVADVTRPILSVGSLNRQGIKVNFDGDRSILQTPSRTYQLLCHRNLFYLPVKVLESSGCDEEMKEALDRIGESRGSEASEDSDEDLPSLVESDSDGDDMAEDDMEVNAGEEEVADEEMDAGSDTEEEDAPWKLQRTPEQGEEAETRKVKLAPTARCPSQREWDRHQALHVPYARWCKLCVKTRAKERKHAKIKAERIGDTPLIELDFSFLKMAEQEKLKPILIGCHVQSSAGLAVQLKTKSAADPRAMKAILQFLEYLGIHGKVILRVDPETTMHQIAQQVARRRGEENTFIETTVKRSYGSIGAADHFAQEVVGLTRTLVGAVKASWGKVVNTRSALLPWAVRHATWLLNTFQPRGRQRGRSSYEVLRGKKYGGEIFRFAEPVMVRRPGATGFPKLRERWEEGLWLGKSLDTDGHLVGGGEGIIISRSIVPLVEKNEVIYDRMDWTPWGKATEEILPGDEEAPKPRERRRYTRGEEVRGERDEQPRKRARRTRRILKEQVRRRIFGKRPPTSSAEKPIIKQRRSSEKTEPAVEDVPMDQEEAGQAQTFMEDEKDEVQFTQTKPPWIDPENGQPLDKDQVETGMQRERLNFRRFKVKQEVPYSEYEEALRSGKKVVLERAGWVLRQKREGVVRARLVATQISDKSDPDSYYCPTPKQMSHRLVMTRAFKRGWKCIPGDVTTAFLQADLLLDDDTVVFIIPPETETGGRKVLWKVSKAVYGLRASPKYFNVHFGKVVCSLGWRRTKCEPQLFYNPRFKGALMSVHTDDILATASNRDMPILQAEIQKVLQLRWEEPLGEQWQKFLGVEWQLTSKGIKCRVPRKYVETLLEEWQMGKCKTVGTPMVKTKETAELEQPVDQATHRRYRRAVGKLMWLMSWRPEMNFTTNKLSRKSAGPNVGDMQKLKRCLRFLRGHDFVTFDLTNFGNRNGCNEDDRIYVWVDSDWSAPRSTSGWVIVWKGTVMQTSTKTQATPAQSSAEAEVVAANEAAKEAVWLLNILEELEERKHKIVLFCDASAAVSFMKRKGVGRIKHLALRELWIQEQVEAGKIQVEKVATSENIADMFTKPLPEQSFRMFAWKLGVQTANQEELHVIGDGSESQKDVTMEEPRGPRERAAALRGEGTRTTYGTQNPQLTNQELHRQQVEVKRAPKPKRKSKEKATEKLEQRQEAGSSSQLSMERVPVNISVQVHQTGGQGGSESGRMEGTLPETVAPVEVQQLEYIAFLLRRRGKEEAEIQFVLSQVTSKQEAFLLITNLVANE